MATIVFDPDQIGSNSSNIVTNDTDITSNYTEASDNTSDIVLNDTDITSNYTEASDAASDAAVASNAASDAVDDASDASVAASSAASDVDVIEADDRYAKSVYSDPATDSFVVTQLNIASDSKVYISHSDSAIA